MTDTKRRKDGSGVAAFITGVIEPSESLNRETNTRVYGRRQTSESRLDFLKINNKHTRIVQNVSYVYGEHESANLHLVTANGKRKIRRNHGHVVTFAVCRFP